VKEEPSTKTLCLRAWADICTEKRIGGLGIRNLQAINQGLILSTAWRLAKEPQSHIALILKSKYHSDTSIWRAKQNMPKSAFWTAILKVRPLLISASSYQIVDGSSSVWSSPWFSHWQTIYENLIIQQPSYNYPAVVKDLWVPNQKTWNVELVKSLFTPLIADAILETPIVNAIGQDILVWKLTPAGECTSKSAYKHCFNNLSLPAHQRPKPVPQQVVNLLNKVWKEKLMAPRVQTFAWRLLRRALPTGKRASKFSKHIGETCARCGSLEDEMHMLFLCPFSKAAWFSPPWYIRTEVLAVDNQTIPQMIKILLELDHPHINITSLYTFLWCLWKTRNDALFGRKYCKPSQVYPEANAIMQGSKLDDLLQVQNQHSSFDVVHRQITQQEPCLTIGQRIFCDAAWTMEENMQSSPAGIGVIIQFEDNEHCKQLHISAMSPPVTSSLQAEAYGLLLATILAGILNIQEPHYYTDCLVLASAATKKSIFKEAGHWNVRPMLASILASPSFVRSRVVHINRCFNVKAHHQAKLAIKIQNRPVAFRCLCSDSTGSCIVRNFLEKSSVSPFTLLSVKCC
jgi:hypothetical protein